MPLPDLSMSPMPKLPVLTPRKVEKKLKKLGFTLDHTTGSHRIWYHPLNKRRAVVPLHTKDLKPGTFAAILREANISRDEFLAS